MDAVKSFNDELSSIYETKPPVSRAKMTLLTKKAIKGIKFYKHIVQSMEKFIQKCRPEYKVPGLYVIDSVVRQSRHQFGHEKDVFMPRLCKNIITTFKHLYKSPQEDKQKIIRVLNLWQKNSVFPQHVVQELLVMGGAPTPEATSSSNAGNLNLDVSEPTAVVTGPAAADNAEQQPDPTNLTNMLAQLLANPDNPQIQQVTGMLSNSQQAQLKALVNQVKNQATQQTTPVVEPPKPPDIIDQSSASVFQALSNNLQPPFLHSLNNEVSQAHRPAPSFNRAILDYDYSDDESKSPKDAPRAGIDMELLAKLPTVDQLQQLTSASGDGPVMNGDGMSQQENERRRRLEAEQEVFNKQIQQFNPDFNNQQRPDDQDGERDNSAGHRRSTSSSRKRSRSSSRSRNRHRNRRSRSRDRNRRSRRSRSREHRRSRRSRSQDHTRERERKGLPPIREGSISLCTTTLWIGNISSKVTQLEIKNEVEKFGPIESINMIPPRGCAYICMTNREDAIKALHKLRYVKIGGKSLKVDWAPGKGVKDEFKEFWSKEQGVNYIPFDKCPVQLLALKDQGFIDIETVPQEKRAELEQALKEPEPKPDEVDDMKHAVNLPAAPVMMPPGGMIPGMNVPPGAMIQGPGGVGMMMRPAGLPFPGMMPPQMARFPIPQGGMPARPVRSECPPQEPRKGETLGAKTPTRDEHGDEIVQASAGQVMLSSQQPGMQPPFTMAQRFPGVGQMPVQIRMMQGMPPHSPQVMQHQRIRMMPIRMGMPMHFRHGFPPGVRVPMSSQHIMANPFQQQQMQQMGAMMSQRMPQSPMHMQRGPMPIRSPGFPNDRRMSRENDHPPIDGDKPLNPTEGPPQRGILPDEPLRPQPSPEREAQPRNMGEPPRMDPSRMNEGDGRPPVRSPPHRDEPPHRFGFEGRRPPIDGGMNRPPDGPRGPINDHRFPDHGMMGRGGGGGGRRRSDDIRRRERSRSRERERSRGMRDRRFERDDRSRDFNRDRRGGFGDRDRGRRGGFGDRDFGGRDRGGFRGRDDVRFQEIKDETDEEDQEYQRKREEILKKRREGEDDYVAEEIDLSAFGLPSGFGNPEKEKKEKEEEKEPKEERKSERDDDRRRDRDKRDRDRRDDRDRDRRYSDRRRDDRYRDDRRDSRRDRRDDDRRDERDLKRRKTENDKDDSKKTEIKEEIRDTEDASRPGEKANTNTADQSSSIVAESTPVKEESREPSSENISKDPAEDNLEEVPPSMEEEKDKTPSENPPVVPHPEDNGFPKKEEAEKELPIFSEEETQENSVMETEEPTNNENAHNQTQDDAKELIADVPNVNVDEVATNDEISEVEEAKE